VQVLVGRAFPLQKNNKQTNKQNKTKQNKEKRQVLRRAIFAGHRVQEHNPLCYKWARRGEESKLPSLLYGPLCAAARALFFGKTNLLMGVKLREKKQKKKIVPKRSGPIFCRGGLRLAGL
jgi:hypothetical protein